MTTTETNKSNTKWIWIGLGAAALFCLCAVALAIFLLGRVGQQVKQGMKTDPKGASEAAHAIADYDLPTGYRERVAMDFLVYSMVMIGPDTTGSSTNAAKPIIMLAQFQVVGDRQQMEEQIRHSFEQQSGRRGLTMKLVEVKKKIIRGQEVDVSTFEGSDNSGLVLRQMITLFPGKHGTAMLMVMGATQYWDKPAIDKFIESIH